MTGANTLDLTYSDFERGLLGAHRITLARGSGGPVFHRVRLGRVELDVRLQRLEPLWKLSHDLLQSALPDFEIALSCDLLRGREVEAGLRFVSIGDRCGADFEIALRLGELFGDRNFLRLDESEPVLRSEHVEISLRDADNQILRRLAECGFSLYRLESGLLVRLNVLPIEERLRERHGISVRIAQTILILLRGCASESYGDVVVLGERCGVDGGQDLGKALRQTFKTCVARRTRRGVGGIVRESVAVNLQKIR